MAAEASNRFQSCENQLAKAPGGSDAAACFVKVADTDALKAEAARRMAALLPRHPQNHWLELYLGNIEWYRKPEHAIVLYRAAARGFADQRDPEGEVRARYNLRNLLYERDRIDEAETELKLTLHVARRSGRPQLIGQALILQATHLTQKGEDLGRAYRSLREAEPLLFPDGPYPFRRGLMRELAGVCFTMGRLEEALSYYHRYEALARQAGDGNSVSAAKLGRANTILTQLEDLPREEDRDEVIGLAEGALKLATASGNRRNRILSHQLLGDVLRHQDPARARRHLDECLTLARENDDRQRIGDCLWSLGAYLAETDPSSARRRIAEALSLAVESGNKLSVAYASRQRMRVSWKTGPRETAIRDSVDALDTIEALRDLQNDTQGSTGLLSAWAKEYYLALGSLLNSRDRAPERSDLELAFSIAERLRARVMLEKLVTARWEPVLPPSDPLRSGRRQALEGIVELHRRLLDPGLVGEGRREVLGELERVELREADLEAEIDRKTRGRSPASRPAFATLAEVEAGLATDEALLSFQVALWEDVYGDFGGGSWLLAATRKRTRVFRLPDRVRLEPAMPLLLGLFERRDGSEAVATAELHRELLEEALDGLPPEVNKLVVVPDGALHRLPFAALRRSSGSEPLVERYQICVVPSATLWLQWRRGRPGAPERAALAMADPEPLQGGGSTVPAEERAWLMAEGTRLGRLPYARREGRAVVRHLGGASRLVVGAEASEHLLKHADLQQVGVLHFAAHAVVDEENPERTAVLLGPGATTEDGFLQVREIGDLHLDGQIVVLSACRTASGSVLRGEGVLGLARAFFLAGARAVVGSLWPLRDDEAAAIFDGFYRHLATGESVAEALRQAQRDAIRAGLPASAWAGLVVLGDGNLTLPPSTASRDRSVREVLLAVVILATGVTVLVIRHRRRRSAARPNELTAR